MTDIKMLLRTSYKTRTRASWMLYIHYANWRDTLKRRSSERTLRAQWLKQSARQEKKH